jgi:error-prone DNA polymerase
VAIVRPGPIQGDMVHPYLRRRMGIEKPSIIPSPELNEGPRQDLGRAAVPGTGDADRHRRAGFSPGEADQLRRAMATFKRNGTIEQLKPGQADRGHGRNGYSREFAERCFSQIEGFGDYGFPESHAASFALLVYASCLVQDHYPDVFCAAILNASRWASTGRRSWCAMRRIMASR